MFPSTTHKHRNLIYKQMRAMMMYVHHAGSLRRSQAIHNTPVLSLPDSCVGRSLHVCL